MKIWGWAAELKKPRNHEAKTWKKWLLEAEERDLAGRPEDPVPKGTLRPAIIG